MTIALAEEDRGTQTDTSPRRRRRAATDLGAVATAELVQAAATGESRAWDELVRRFGRLVWSVTRAQGLSEADGADVYQVVWLQLVDHLGQIRDPERLGSWLATTARYECFRTLRRRGRMTPAGTFEADDVARHGNTSMWAPDAAPDEDRIEAIDRSGRSRPLAAIVATLPQHHQALLGLLMADPAPSYKEIAGALDMPVGSIGPTRQRILATLRQRCEAEGISLDDGG